MPRVALFVGALVSVTHAQHYSWDWFYADMCGCTQTKFEGCGVSSALLFQVLTDSHGLQVCANSSGLGDMTEEQTSQEFAGDEKVEERVKNECEVRLQLKTVAAEFEVCRTLHGKAACDGKMDLCEWEAQDVGECGIDEEKLLHKLVPEEYRSHPLVQNILIQDRCSEMPHDRCIKNMTCGWVRQQNRCVANDAIIFNSFLEHPAMFQILDIAERGAHCRGWHEHVWHGSRCWAEHCHLERGICTGNSGYTLEAEPNLTTVQNMKNDLCRVKGWMWQNQQGHFRGKGGQCPPGCRVQNRNSTNSPRPVGRHGHHHGYRGHEEEMECEAEPIPEDADLSLTEMDKKIALYFLVLRSATTIHESRCNSLDIDMMQCQKVATEHIDCQGMFHPNATQIFGGTERPLHHRNEDKEHHDEQAAAVIRATEAKQAVGGSAVQQGKLEENAVMENVIKNVAKPDAGVGVNGGMDDIMSMASSANKDAFLQRFGDWLQQPDTQETIEQIRETVPQFVQGFLSIWQDVDPDVLPTTTDALLLAEAHMDESPASHAVLVCIACLLLASVCGGFAWGVLLTNRMRTVRGPALLETEYMRHSDPPGGA
mmetsp:Transcript_8579/g.15364  ORF Transcript_8579/g.15364 Transcript_8579/m.15364 type:complete len:596 (-) Transcript_8579:434-2221(-)